MAGVEEMKNSLWRRDEQLKRWDLSETNTTPIDRQSNDKCKVSFQDGCVFLAACASCDTEEIESLLKKGADINTANIDGLTSLHQACIDNNLHMVEFLVERGTDIDASDSEGWTPLHAAASCGFSDITKYLVDKGAKVDAVNSDGDLAIDLAEGDDVAELLICEMDRHGIDAEVARCEEEELMLKDAKQWLNVKKISETPHHKTGATALHVAAAKGYLKVMKVLIEAGAVVDCVDFDGWTPLHAATHWGQEEACKVLVDNMCNMDVCTPSGQTVMDLAESCLVPLLEDLKKSQEIRKTHTEDVVKDLPIRSMPVPKRRTSVTRLSGDQKHSIGHKTADEERQMLGGRQDTLNDDTSSDSTAERPDDASPDVDRKRATADRRTDVPPPAAVVKIETRDDEAKDAPEDDVKTKTKQAAVESDDESDEEDEEDEEEESSEAEESSSDSETEKQNEKNRQTTLSTKPQANGVPAGGKLAAGTARAGEKQEIRMPPPLTRPVAPAVTKTGDAATAAAAAKSLRREADKENDASKTTTTADEMNRSAAEERNSRPGVIANTTEAKDDAKKTTTEGFHDKAMCRTTSVPHDGMFERRVRQDGAAMRRLHSSGSTDSFETRNNNEARLRQDKRFNDFYTRYATQFSSSRTGVATEPPVPGRSASLQSYVPLSQRRQMERDQRTERERERMLGITTTAAPTATSPTSPSSNSLNRRSFEPPKRDEEKEIERKARARRARETRRSTQGVTKEDVERAELALQAANKGIDLAVLNAAKRASMADKKDDVTPDVARRRAWANGGDESKESLSNACGSGDSTATTDTTSASFVRGLRSSVTSSAAATTAVPTVTVSATETTATTTPAVTTAVTTTAPFRASFRSKYLRTGTEDDDATAKKKDETTADDTEKTARKEGKEEREDPSQKSAAIRMRRKRESRRATGKILLEDIQSAIPPMTADSENQSKEKPEDRTSSRYGGGSRYGSESGGGVGSSSSSSLYDSSTPSRYSSSLARDRPSSYTAAAASSYSRSYAPSYSTDDKVDYKRLFEQQKTENDRLKKDVQRLQTDLSESKLDLEKSRMRNESVKSYDTSLDKREKRALERRISELEEELKAMENLKADNQRLKEENGALIRVISKLSK